jgi:hypothetical protein
MQQINKKSQFQVLKTWLFNRGDNSWPLIYALAAGERKYITPSASKWLEVAMHKKLDG